LGASAVLECPVANFHDNFSKKMPAPERIRALMGALAGGGAPSVIGKPVASVDTPALILDLDALEHNIKVSWE
jgi:hypothetical protein